MSTLHRWFRSGRYSLLGHLDVPQENRGRGVVIVSPFGWEDVCSYRPLRFMAQIFAGAGIPTLRYDLPGTGDSSGDARDPGLLESWIQSVEDAAEELRNTAGVEDVAVVGVHLGAMLAAIAASRRAKFQALVLWGPAAQGRAVLRELRAAANIERGESLAEKDAPPQPVPGFASGGFLISPETQHALENIDISTVSWPQLGRILLLSRDDLPHDAKLLDALRRSATNVEMATGSGYFAMMAAPQEAPCPEETSRLIAEFLTRDTAEHPRRISTQSPVASATAVREPIGDGYFESIYRIETSTFGMFGILAKPGPAIPRSEFGILYLNPGSVRHTGPNRMWVESARRWAARGVVSLRLDLQSIGESDGEQYLDVASLYREHLMEQIEAAIDSLRSHAGPRKFVAIGLCSGACWAFHAAVRNPDVRAAILLNPAVLYWDPKAERRRLLHGMTEGYTFWAEWFRRIRGGIQRRDFTRAARRAVEKFSRTRPKQDGYLQLGFKTMAQAWASLERAKKQVTLILGDAEPLLAELEDAGQLPPDTNCFVRCVRVPNGGHTLRPLWAQKIVHDHIDIELARVVGAPPAPAGLDESSGPAEDRTCLKEASG